MKNFRKSKLFALATVLTIVFGAFAVSSADAGCGYGGFGYSSHYAPTYTSHFAPSYGHFAPTYGCGYTIPTYSSCYAPTYFATPYCGGLYW